MLGDNVDHMKGCGRCGASGEKGEEETKKLEKPTTSEGERDGSGGVRECVRVGE